MKISKTILALLGFLSAAMAVSPEPNSASLLQENAPAQEGNSAQATSRLQQKLAELPEMPEDEKLRGLCYALRLTNNDYGLQDYKEFMAVYQKNCPKPTPLQNLCYFLEAPASRRNMPFAVSLFNHHCVDLVRWRNIYYDEIRVVPSE